MKFSAAQAGKEVGRSTATITRAIEKGKLSAVKDENGAWEIDPSELFRAFAPKTPENPAMKRDANPDEKGETGAEIRGLERLVETLQQELARLREDRAEQVADLRSERDHWREEAAALRRLLPPPAPVEPAPAPEMPAAAAPVVRGRGLWSWLRGRGAND